VKKKWFARRAEECPSSDETQSCAFKKVPSLGPIHPLDFCDAVIVGCSWQRSGASVSRVALKYPKPLFTSSSAMVIEGPFLTTGKILEDW
jgi:hypothetical protein